MCIAIVTTAHPQYPFILLNNRDEYLHRPTADARWWDPPNEHVLGGFDLHRAEHGTWLGITRQGRIAVLTNYREEGQAIIQGARSRGGIVNAWLTEPPNSPETTEQFAERLMEGDGVRGVGGFSLFYGRVRDVIFPDQAKAGEKGLAIISNRTPDVKGLIWLAGHGNETHALSNASFGDRSWPKVTKAEERVNDALKASVAANESPSELAERLFSILSVDELPRQRNGEEWEIYLRQLRHSIFIPAVGDGELQHIPADVVAAAHDHEPISATSGVYGTQKQTLTLVDREGKVTFIERSLFDGTGKGEPVPKEKRDLEYHFDIEGWDKEGG